MERRHTDHTTSVGIAVAAACLVLAVLVSGCGVTALTGKPGINAPRYVVGTLRSRERVSLNRAYIAAKGALSALGYVKTVDDKTAVAARLVARDKHDTKISVRLDWETPRITEVAIRVGLFGDESTSWLILKEMRKRY